MRSGPDRDCLLARILDRLDFRLRPVAEPYASLFEPAGMEGVHLLVALGVKAVTGVLKDMDGGTGHHAFHLAGAGFQDGWVIRTETLSNRYAGGGQRGIGVFPSAHREVSESRRQRPAIALVSHLFADITLKPVLRRRAGFIILPISGDRIHCHHAPEPVPDHRRADQRSLKSIRTRYTETGRDKQEHAGDPSRMARRKFGDDRPALGQADKACGTGNFRGAEQGKQLPVIEVSIVPDCRPVGPAAPQGSI